MKYTFSIGGPFFIYFGVYTNKGLGVKEWFLKGENLAGGTS
jgi:hypothetical protein